MLHKIEWAYNYFAIKTEILNRTINFLQYRLSAHRGINIWLRTKMTDPTIKFGCFSKSRPELLVKRTKQDLQWNGVILAYSCQRTKYAVFAHQWILFCAKLWKKRSIPCRPHGFPHNALHACLTHVFLSVPLSPLLFPFSCRFISASVTSVPFLSICLLYTSRCV